MFDIRDHGGGFGGGVTLPPEFKGETWFMQKNIAPLTLSLLTLTLDGNTAFGTMAQNVYEYSFATGNSKNLGSPSPGQTIYSVLCNDDGSLVFVAIKETGIIYYHENGKWTSTGRVSNSNFYPNFAINSDGTLLCFSKDWNLYKWSMTEKVETLVSAESSGIEDSRPGMSIIDDNAVMFIVNGVIKKITLTNGAKLMETTRISGFIGKRAYNRNPKPGEKAGAFIVNETGSGGIFQLRYLNLDGTWGNIQTATGYDDLSTDKAGRYISNVVQYTSNRFLRNMSNLQTLFAGKGVPISECFSSDLKHHITSNIAGSIYTHK